MLLVTIAGFFVVLFAIIFAFAYRKVVKPAKILEQVALSAKISSEKEGALEDMPAMGFARLLASLGSMLPSSPREDKLTRSELIAAGVRYAHAVPVFAGIKVLSCGGFLIGGLILRTVIGGSDISRLLMPAFAGFIGYMGPSFVLSRMIKARRERIRLALPDVLDLLVISTEAGCALDKAILNVSKEFRDFHPDISEELALVNAEMLAGNSRTEALRNFASRTGEPELSKLVAMLMQTDRFGTSVATALRTQSEFMRVQRRQAAEEKAGKVGVKLVFPIFFFCMPSLGIIVAGPGLLQIMEVLPTLSGN